MPEGVTPRQAASSFVNPLTVLGTDHSMDHSGPAASTHLVSMTPLHAHCHGTTQSRASGMLSTALEEGHTALVHTAAASQLGQMMVRTCLADQLELVNVVRRPEQEQVRHCRCRAFPLPLWLRRCISLRSCSCSRRSTRPPSSSPRCVLAGPASAAAAAPAFHPPHCTLPVAAL